MYIPTVLGFITRLAGIVGVVVLYVVIVTSVFNSYSTLTDETSYQQLEMKKTVNNIRAVNRSVVNVEIIGDISKSTVTPIVKELERLSKGSKLIITMDSRGGNVYEGIKLIEAIYSSKAHVTINLKHRAYSMAAILLGTADSVIIPKGAAIMYHTIQDCVIKDKVKKCRAVKPDSLFETKRNGELSMMMLIMLKRLGKLLTTEEIYDIIYKQEEIWLTGQEYSARLNMYKKVYKSKIR